MSPTHSHFLHESGLCRYEEAGSCLSVASGVVPNVVPRKGQSEQPLACNSVFRLTPSSRYRYEGLYQVTDVSLVYRYTFKVRWKAGSTDSSTDMALPSAYQTSHGFPLTSSVLAQMPTTEEVNMRTGTVIKITMSQTMKGR